VGTGQDGPDFAQNEHRIDGADMGALGYRRSTSRSSSTRTQSTFVSGFCLSVPTSDAVYASYFAGS
jgi:hypothetical protein